MGKTLEQLRLDAIELNIQNADQMSEKELRTELWKIIYGYDFIPSNSAESCDFLMSHPDHTVKQLARLWMGVGGKDIIKALEVLTRSHVSASCEDPTNDTLEIFGLSEDFNVYINTLNILIYTTMSKLSWKISALHDQYQSREALKKHEGDVLFLCSPSDGISEEKKPFKVIFYETGKNEPVNSRGWMLLPPGAKELTKKLIKQRWQPYEDMYLVDNTDIQGLQEYLAVIGVSGGLKQSE